MKQFCELAAVCLAATLIVLPAVAQEAKKSAPRIVDATGAAEVVTLRAKIVAIDAGKRIVTVRGLDGRPVEIYADERVKNFARIKVGDEVVVRYQRSIALALRKGGDGIREEVESEAAARAQPGAKPGAAAVRQTTIVANVEAVDPKKKLVTLRGPKGNFVDVRVRDPKIMKEVKVGDQVVVRATEALAIAVRAAPAAAKKS